MLNRVKSGIGLKQGDQKGITAESTSIIKNYPINLFLGADTIRKKIKFVSKMMKMQKVLR